MITGINHIGIVVKDIDETLGFLKDVLGAEELQRLDLSMVGQISSEVKFGDSKYELMQPVGDKGVVADFLNKTGGGFHHISLLSDDFDTDIEHFKSKGVQILGISPMNGMRYAFTHPKTSGGILYEIAGK